MHGLDIIIRRNAEAAGREAAAAQVDGDNGHRVANAICETFTNEPFTPQWRAFYKGYTGQRDADDAQYGKQI